MDSAAPFLERFAEQEAMDHIVKHFFENLIPYEPEVGPPATGFRIVSTTFIPELQVNHQHLFGDYESLDEARKMLATLTADGIIGQGVCYTIKNRHGKVPTRYDFVGSLALGKFPSGEIFFAQGVRTSMRR